MKKKLILVKLYKMPKRVGRKSAAQTPAPKSDKIYGSKKNKVGSASEGDGIKLSAKTEDTLKQKLIQFKEKYPNKKNISISDLKAVYRRGSGAYSKSHRPTITGGAPNSRAAWSYARVNKFLEKAAGKPVKKAYVQDDDLFAKGGKTKGGDCYLKAGSFCLLPDSYKFIGKPYLVHAEVRGQGKIEGLRYGHAWVEDDENVYDFSNGREIIMPKPLYYYYGNIKTDNPKKYQRYTFPEARAKMLKTNHYGSWDIETEYADGGEMSISEDDYEFYEETSQEIQCVNCGWKWETADSDENDMYVCHQCGFDNTLYYINIMSKLKKPMSVSEISREHGVDEKYIENQLDTGIKHELEHTNDEGIARIIALHHIGEKPNYYELVDKYKLEDGGQSSKFWHKSEKYEISDFIQNERNATKELLCSSETRISKAIICRAKIDFCEKKERNTSNLEIKNAWTEVKNIWEDCLFEVKNGVVYEFKNGGECGCESKSSKSKEYKDGGLAYGNSHDKGGMPLKVQSTGQNIEIEGGEGVINKRSMQMKKRIDFEGKKLTPCQIVSKINEMGGGVKFKCEDVEEILEKDGSF